MIATRRPAVVVVLQVLVVANALAVHTQGLGTSTGRVVGVRDGDSLVVLRNGRQVEIRLHGADAPEGGQAFGSVCRRALSNLVFGKTVTAEVIEIDRYGRSVARLTVDGRDAGLEMIRGGFAWHYSQYSHDAGYAAAEREARGARRGLWQDAAPEAPWRFRQRRSGPAAPPAPGLRAIAPAPATPAAGPFHGNVSSHVFHGPACQHYDCRSCTAVFATYEAAVAAGYRPHQECAGKSR